MNFIYFCFSFLINYEDYIKKVSIIPIYIKMDIYPLEICIHVDDVKYLIVNVITEEITITLNNI